jgi:hypothetical protein
VTKQIENSETADRSSVTKLSAVYHEKINKILEDDTPNRLILFHALYRDGFA